MSKICVIMPVYNEDNRVLKLSIGSVLSQSHKDFVLIICRDGGNRMPLIEELASSDSRIVYLDNDDNLGRGANRTRALKLVPEDCDFMCWLDADDMILPGTLEYVDGHLNENVDFLS